MCPFPGRRPEREATDGGAAAGVVGDRDCHGRVRVDGHPARVGPPTCSVDGGDGEVDRRRRHDIGAHDPVPGLADRGGHVDQHGRGRLVSPAWVNPRRPRRCAGRAHLLFDWKSVLPSLSRSRRSAPTHRCSRVVGHRGKDTACRRGRTSSRRPPRVPSRFVSIEIETRVGMPAKVVGVQVCDEEVHASGPGAEGRRTRSGSRRPAGRSAAPRRGDGRPRRRGSVPTRWKNVDVATGGNRVHEIGADHLHRRGAAGAAVPGETGSRRCRRRA